MVVLTKNFLLLYNILCIIFCMKPFVKNTKSNSIFALFLFTAILIAGVFVFFFNHKETVTNADEDDISYNIELMINNRTLSYNGDIYGAFYNSNRIDFGDLPIISNKGVLLVRIKKLVENLGCSYSQSNGTINVKRGNINLNLTLDSDIAYVNGKKIIMDAPPTIVSNRGTDVAYAMAPIEFCLDALGFGYSFDYADKDYFIYDTDSTGRFENNRFLQALSSEISSAGNVNVNVAENELFNFTMLSEYETVLEEERHKGSGKSYLTEVAGYSLDFSDAIVLFGIEPSDVDVMLDGNMLIAELKGTGNLCGDELYMSEENKYLNYCLISGDMNTTRIITYLEADQKFYVYDLDSDYVSIHITSEDVYSQDSGYSLSENIKPQPKPSGSPENGSNSPEKQEIKLPDDRLLIPLPEGCSMENISDTDNYLNYNFVIKVKGNIVDYVKEKGIKNPYSYIEGYVLKYNESTGLTNISFDTKVIVAYKYEIISGYLCIKVARPDEIYDKIVLLDAGHGGTDPGASANGTKEKDLNFAVINKYCKDYFEGSGIKAYFTRTTDVLISLENRAAFADEVCADFFISVHMNSNNSSSPNGTELFYSKNNNRMQNNGLMSQDIAQMLVDNISAAIGTKNRGITPENFYVIKYNKVPAVLVETGFLSNPSDYKIITDANKQKKVAEAIYKTCVQIFNLYSTSR